MKLYHLSTVFLFVSLISLSGCAHKSIYRPDKILGSAPDAPVMGKHIEKVVREGAIFSNGNIVTKRKGLLPLNIPKGFIFVNDSDDSVIVTDDSGSLEIISLSNKKIRFRKTFQEPVISATLKGNYLAAVLANNTILLYDIAADKELYKEALDKVITIDARAANPLFLNDLIVFPTLDGRLLIMQSDQKTVLRDVAISDKALFNNVIFLKVNDNKLVAATASKIIVITPQNIYTYKAAIKDVLYIGHDIYLFEKNGTVVHLDERLHKISERPFAFANYVAVASVGDKIYMVEKQGYLISMDKNLANIKVQKFDDEFEKSVMIAKGVLYTDDKAIKLK